MITNKDYDITDVWKLVISGQDYNSRTNFYNTVDENLAYVMGDQWRGVKAGNLPKPVFNIIKRSRDYKVSSIMSQRVKGIYSVENISSTSEDQSEQQVLSLIEMMNNYAEIKWEKDKMDSKVRDCLMDGYTSGCYAIYTYWDANKKTGQNAEGDFCNEVIDGVNILFGNPNSTEVEKQPYIILLGRELVKALKKEAEENGVSKHLIDSITADTDTQYTAGDAGKIEIDRQSGESGKSSYAIKLWKEDGKVYYSKSTRFCVIKDKVDMKISRYPLAFGNWEKTKNNYHGRAECTDMLPNQRYINKQFAMIMLWMMNNAMGKVAYDSTVISGYSNQVGTAIPVNGSVNGAIQQLNAGNFNSGVLEVINLSIKETLQSLGVNDVVLGNIKPENTSAIIAVQKQSAVPLENVQSNLYQFIEDIFLIWAEFISTMYNVDRMIPQDIEGETGYVKFNGERLKDKLFNVKIDVGASNTWSEITSIQTLDALLQTKHITLKQYLKRIPDGIVPDKDTLIDEIEQQEMQQQQLQEQQMAMQEQQQTSQQPQVNKDQQYEEVAQMLEQLPPEQQQQFMQLSPEDQELAIEEFYSQQ